MGRTGLYISFLNINFEKNLAIKKKKERNNVRVSFSALTERTEACPLVYPCVPEQKYQSKKGNETCFAVTIEIFSCSSANAFLHCSLHLVCKDYIDPTHRDDTTPLQAGLSINIPSLPIQHVPYFLC